MSDLDWDDPLVKRLLRATIEELEQNKMGTLAMSNLEFKPWPKIARLNRDIIITEKIDGTNSCVVILEDGTVGAQSRNRIIEPGPSDNHGFAGWVEANKDELRNTLGPGYHFGEWWGSGIQRGYGLPKGEKRFSLFNTTRWEHIGQTKFGLTVVPKLFEGMFHQEEIEFSLDCLRRSGSYAAPGFDKPEGIVIFHTASNYLFKVTLENDEAPKGKLYG